MISPVSPGPARLEATCKPLMLLLVEWPHSPNKLVYEKLPLGSKDHESASDESSDLDRDSTHKNGILQKPPHIFNAFQCTFIYFMLLLYTSLSG